MVAFLCCAVGILLITVLFLSIKLYLMKKSASEIASGVAERITEDTNTLIAISSRDKRLRLLASEINRQLIALRDERHRFQQGDRELKEAITNISHDLRTPLTAICGYLELLEREEKSEAVSHYIGIIANRTETLKALTEELFRYSVIASTNDASKDRLVLNHVLEESLISHYGTMEQHGIRPQISITETRVERTLNRSALSRVFDNIIANAVKYSDGDLVITMDNYGTIAFSNSAKALNAVDVGKLFDRFFTVETGKSSTGLGLSIAKLLTERMDGIIDAKYENKRLFITIAFPPVD